MKGFRTVVFNAIMLLVGLFGADQVSPEMANEAANSFMVIWAVGNALLRGITNSPIFKKEGE